MTDRNIDSHTAPLETYGNAEYISDYYAVDAIRAFVPDLGRRPLTLGEFYQLAQRLDVSIHGNPGRREGFCVVFAGSTHVFLDESLPEQRKTFVAYHEITHAILHAAYFPKLKIKADWDRAERWMSGRQI
jgi:Zn-dependent peptidase ImmA (M78 family)